MQYLCAVESRFWQEQGWWRSWWQAVYWLCATWRQLIDLCVNGLVVGLMDWWWLSKRKAGALQGNTPAKDSRSDEYSSLYKRILLALWQKESASQYATPDALLKKVQTPWYGRDVCSDEICSKITHLQVRQRLSGMAFWCRLFSPLDKKRGCACAETSMKPCLCIFARNNDQGLQWSRQSLNSTDRYQLPRPILNLKHLAPVLSIEASTTQWKILVACFPWDGMQVYQTLRTGNEPWWYSLTA